MQRALSDIRVLDLTRILAGPTCTQLLGDLGCDVLKIEKPGAGDDTRKWGPPYVTGEDGEPTQESAYYLAANRNKRSVAIDIAKPEGQALVRRLLARCDVLVHNFKTGTLDRYGLGWADLQADFPGLVYCSISGFGQTGPYKDRAGYDYLAQGYGGIMSITGTPDGEPMKVGVGIADIVCGMYATSAILAALHYKAQSGLGQHIDLALLDTQVAWLANAGTNYLLSGQVPQRLGNEHPNIVPYKLFEAKDGPVILAAGNDAQYQRFCRFAGVPELSQDPRFVSNPLRLQNRDALYARLTPVFLTKTKAEWVDGLTALGVPCGPVNRIDEVFEDPQVQHRGMRIEMPHPLAATGTVPLLGNPIKMSATPPAYAHPPPFLGQHTDAVLAELLAVDAAERERLRRAGVIG